MRARRLLLTVLVIPLVLPVVSTAQQPFDATPPAYVAVVAGAATLDRDDQSQVVSAGIPLVPGDRLRTGRGRVEVLFPDGSALDVDEFSSLELLDGTLLRLTEGRLL